MKKQQEPSKRFLKNVEATVNRVKVAKGGEAEAFGFIGSPTILINGHDVEPEMDHTTP